MRRTPLLAFLLLAAPAQAQAPAQAALQDCSVAESEGLRAGEETSAIGLAFSGDGPERHVIATVPRAAAGPAPRTELRPARQGMSYGTALTQEGGAGQAAFTLATVEPAGTVLLETWRWRAAATGSAAPDYAWARLRCGP